MLGSELGIRDLFYQLTEACACKNIRRVKVSDLDGNDCTDEFIVFPFDYGTDLDKNVT